MLLVYVYNLLLRSKIYKRYVFPFHMFEAEFSNWKDGNFILKTNRVYVSNLEMARENFQIMMENSGSILKNTFENYYTKTKGENFLKSEYYNMWRFEDLFFLKGILITFFGVTNYNSDCMCKPYSTASYNNGGLLVGLDEFCDSLEHSNFDRNFGIKGRDASPSDSGYLRLKIECYSHLKPTNSNIYKITHIPKSPNVSLMLVDKLRE